MNWIAPLLIHRRRQQLECKYYVWSFMFVLLKVYTEHQTVFRNIYALIRIKHYDFSKTIKGIALRLCILILGIILLTHSKPYQLPWTWNLPRNSTISIIMYSSKKNLKHYFSRTVKGITLKLCIHMWGIIINTHSKSSPYQWPQAWYSAICWKT